MIIVHYCFIIKKARKKEMIFNKKTNNEKENLFITSDPALVKRLDESIEQINNGEIVEFSLEEFKELEK